MRNITILTLFLLTFHKGRTQGIPLDNYEIDTISLRDFSEKKVIAYKLSYVTVYFRQVDCKKDCKELFKIYNCDKAKENRSYTVAFRNSDYGRRKILLDSIYDLLHNKKLARDTLFIDFKTFQTAGLRGFDIGKYLEKSNCKIISEAGELQSKLIRQKGSWYRGPLAAWGGRRYFLPGYTSFFYEETDWIS